MAAGVSVVMMCGLPAAGKTSFCTALKDKWDLVLGEKKAHVIHICFDDIIPANLDLDFDQECVSMEHASQEKTWKQYRRSILDCFEKLLITLRASDTLITNSESNGTLYKTVWQNMTHSLTSGCKGCLCFTGNQSASSCSPCFRWDRSTPHVFVIDDNMFYRSMRYEYFQVARKYSCGFLQLYIQCPLEVVLRRNSTRQRQEKEKTLANMHNQLEEPKPASFSWEKYSITVNLSTHTTFCSYRHQVVDLLEEAMRNPFQPIPEENIEEKEMSRQACAESTAHQADQVVRKLISRIMEQRKGQLHKKELQELGRELNTRRKEFLESLKHNDLDRLECILDRKSNSGLQNRKLEHAYPTDNPEQYEGSELKRSKETKSESSTNCKKNLQPQQNYLLEDKKGLAVLPCTVQILLELKNGMDLEQQTCLEERKSLNDISSDTNSLLKEGFHKRIQDAFLAFSLQKACIKNN